MRHMAIYELDGQAPELPADGSFFIADTATVIGKVRLLSSASVWFGAVLRGAKIEHRRFQFVMLATVLAGFWSLMSGTFFVMTLRAAGLLA